MSFSLNRKSRLINRTNKADDSIALIFCSYYLHWVPKHVHYNVKRKWHKIKIRCTLKKLYVDKMIIIHVSMMCVVWTIWLHYINMYNNYHITKRTIQMTSHSRLSTWISHKRQMCQRKIDHHISNWAQISTGSQYEYVASHKNSFKY